MSWITRISDKIFGPSDGAFVGPPGAASEQISNARTDEALETEPKVQYEDDPADLMSDKFYVVDISHHEIVESFEIAKKGGVAGVIHKATQGTRFVDPKYATRKEPAVAAGLLWGAYHFGTGDDVATQVDHFLSTVKPTSTTLLALDYEPNPAGKSMSLAQAKEFLERVYKKTGQRPVLYSGHKIKEDLPKKDVFFGQHRLWLAQYGKLPKLPKAWDSYWLWQFTGDNIGPLPHELPGMVGNGLDINKFNGNLKKLKAEWVGAESSINTAPKEDQIPAEPAPTKDTNPDSGANLPWMEVAMNDIGIHETPGSKNNPSIMRWAKEMNIEDYTADSIPWCALGVSHCLHDAGIEISDQPLWALSYSRWGDKLDEAAFGSLLVFKRNGGGHVGWYVGEDSTHYHVLGYNQSDSVNVSKQEKSKLVAIRWPTKFKNLLKKGRVIRKFDGKVLSEKDQV